jgi:hypothetical protein
LTSIFSRRGDILKLRLHTSLGLLRKTIEPGTATSVVTNFIASLGIVANIRSFYRMQYYIRQQGKVKGPYTITQLRSMRTSGAFTEATKFCAEGSDTWYRLNQFANYLDSAPGDEIQTAGNNWTKQKIWAVSGAAGGLVVMFCGLPTIGTALVVAGGIGFIAAQYGGWGTRK